MDELKEKYHITLNAQQEEAVRTVDGAVLLLAVPGSGKTTVLVARLGYMLFARAIPPERILTMTYTVAATRDMRRRFADMFGAELAQKMTFQTINGVSSSIIRRYERMMGRTAFALLEDGGRQTAILGEIYRRKSGDFGAESTIKSLQTAITYAKNMMLDNDEIEKLKPEGIDFAPIYHQYCRTLQERGLMDFDDQMVYAYRILRRFPDILRYYQERFAYVCVDEAQDTSRIQHSIIRLLAQGHGNIFMVGDEDQSIYGFRAAYPEALMNFEADYPGAKILLMEENYRSTRPIVAAADAFIRQNQNRHPKHMTAAREGGCPPVQILFYDRREQYRYLVSEAKNCDRQTAVLYRDNDSALPVIDLLEREKIPYRCRQVDSAFFTNRCVRDITDIIRFAMNPTDGEVFLQIYYKLGAGITKAAAEAAVKQRGDAETPLLARVGAMPGLSQWTVKQCKVLQTHMTNLLTESADKAVYRIVHFMGYGEYLQQRGADTGKPQILEALGALEPTPARLLERLEELNGIVRHGSDEPQCNFILSTIHSSKGLEYDRVILMDVADGILPQIVPARDGSISQEDQAAFEEERRLFYVGMTRAKNELRVFRFKKPELYASFSAAVFPRQQAKSIPAKPVRSPAMRPLRPSAANTAAAKDYLPGARVCHKRYGSGKLTSRREDIITVRFDDGTERRFSLYNSLRQGQFRLEI